VEQRYLNIIRRWLWLFILATLVAGITTYWLVKDQPVLYEAKVRMVIGPGVDTPDPDLNALRAGGQLMQTYAELSMTSPFLQALIDELGLKVTPLMLSESIEVTTNQETQILSIAVRRADPLQAIAIANLAADRLVEISPSGSNSTSTMLKEQMRSQANRIEQVIADSEANITKLEADLQSITQVEGQSVVILQTDNYLQKQQLIIEQLSQERGRLSDALSALTVMYDTLQKTTTNQVKIVEPAVIAMPIPSYLALKVVVGAIAGLALAIAFIVVLEFFDDTVWTPGELDQKIDLPVLGAIAKHKKLEGNGSDELVINKLPDSIAAESYRLLSTKLVFSAREKRQKSIMLSSLGNQNGDASGLVASNLSIALAQTEKRVLLIDADLHQSTITDLLGIHDNPGLTDYLTGEFGNPNLINLDWMPNVSILPSGKRLSNPFKLLSSSRMLDLVKELEKSNDFVLIVTSPVTSFADSLVLSSKVDGLILVARSGEIHIRDIDRVVESLASLGTETTGIVFDLNHASSLENWVKPRVQKIIKGAKSIQKRAETRLTSVSYDDKSASVFPSKAAPSHDNLPASLQHKENSHVEGELFPIQPLKS
jgi:capsular exopolysaccharide synthesis family protein